MDAGEVVAMATQDGRKLWGPESNYLIKGLLGQSSASLPVTGPTWLSRWSSGTNTRSFWTTTPPLRDILSPNRDILGPNRDILGPNRDILGPNRDILGPNRDILGPNRDMEESRQLQTPPPPRSCSSAGPAGGSCWNLDLRVGLLLVTLAGALILLLLYKLLQLRHRLRLARARHALEYSSFYHSATYRLLQPTAWQDPPTKNGTIPEAPPPPIQTVTVAPAVVAPPAPTFPLPPTPPVPRPPSGPQTPRVLSLPLPPPLIHATPPSPHLSWGAWSDADVYSRIGAFRSSRLSSQSTVILFEHSAL